MADEKELCSTQPIFNPDEDVSVDTLKNFEVNEVTQVEDYLRETSEECKVFQIEPETVIAQNKRENEMKIDVISDKSEKPQIESEEDQPLVLVQSPTFPFTFGDMLCLTFIGGLDRVVDQAKRILVTISEPVEDYYDILLYIWQPSTTKPYVPATVSPHDLSVDYSGFITIIFGVACIMFRVSSSSSVSL
ncbi:hypothetical protein Syun_023309 [Stephania yunnanensis]|uniref:Uncharacterized protein n=1 Tax=Stephania yunnanensis TaxID=152371 RepID=A0AAP0FGE0_9MAGN